MKKDELRIRIIPDNGQILIETYTDGIVTCKEVQEDALLDCIKISLSISAVAFCRRVASMSGFIRTKASHTACGIRVCMRTSAIMKRHIQTFHCQDWYSHFVLTQMEKSANAGWGLLRMSG